MTRKSLTLSLGAASVLMVLIVGYAYMSNDWQVVSDNFMKSSKPYGGGDFVISGNEAITLKISDAGKTWSQHKEKATQGGYFNAQTNTLYSLVAYTLKKRRF